jgi:hypothetical protein
MAALASSPKPLDITCDDPVGKGEYIAQAGDCFFSIAEEYGYFWETLWNHPGNAELKMKRGKPSIILPGDRVVLPPKREKQEPRPVDQKHTFVRKGTPVKLRLQFQENGEPLASAPYVLEIDGTRTEGSTDGKGRVEVFIPARARQGFIQVGEGDKMRTYPLDLGRLDPWNSNRGVIARLRNLGLPAGEISEVLTEEAICALREFQAMHKLPITGYADQRTCERLRELHGS